VTMPRSPSSITNARIVRSLVLSSQPRISIPGAPGIAAADEFAAWPPHCPSAAGAETISPHSQRLPQTALQPPGGNGQIKPPPQRGGGPQIIRLSSFHPTLTSNPANSVNQIFCRAEI
jgi:hypothetical protein